MKTNIISGIFLCLVSLGLVSSHPVQAVAPNPLPSLNPSPVGQLHVKTNYAHVTVNSRFQGCLTERSPYENTFWLCPARTPGVCTSVTTTSRGKTEWAWGRVKLPVDQEYRLYAPLAKLFPLAITFSPEQFELTKKGTEVWITAYNPQLKCPIAL